MGFVVLEGIQSAGNTSSILQTREKISLRIEIYLNPERRAFSEASLAIKSVRWRNLQEIFKFVSPSTSLFKYTTSSEWFVSVKETMTSQGLRYGAITGSLRHLPKRDSLSLWIQISPPTKNSGRQEERALQEDKCADGGPNPTWRCWVFHAVFSQKLSLGVSIVINDKAWGKNKPNSNVVSGWFSGKQCC